MEGYNPGFYTSPRRVKMEGTSILPLCQIKSIFEHTSRLDFKPFKQVKLLFTDN